MYICVSLLCGMCCAYVVWLTVGLFACLMAFPGVSGSWNIEIKSVVEHLLHIIPSLFHPLKHTMMQKSDLHICLKLNNIIFYMFLNRIIGVDYLMVQIQFEAFTFLPPDHLSDSDFD